jgi:sterol 3beta-glucosyltransferase
VKVTLLTAGTRGDTQPFIALGVELKKLGHVVKVAGSTTFKSFVEQYGLEFFAANKDMSAVASNAELQEVMQADNPLKMLMSFKTLEKYAFEMQAGFYAACEGADLIIYHPGAAVGHFAAKHLGIPSILASPFPMSMTAEFPSLILYNAPRLGRAFNRLSHRIFEIAMWQTSKSPIRRFWNAKFGKPSESFSNPYKQIRLSNELVLVSNSSVVFQRPKDWPSNIHCEGYWFLDEPAPWIPPPELDAFINSGPPPVYVGFGSMSNAKTAKQTTLTVFEALRKAGKRGVVASGWGGINKEVKVPDSVFLLDAAPHSWLFPKMSAIVHHGGAGTTAESLRAGVPTVVVPHALDQFAWGLRAFELGVGPSHIPKKKLTAVNLAAAIQECDLPELRRNAKTIGALIQRESGAVAAAQTVQSIFLKLPLSTQSIPC